MKEKQSLRKRMSLSNDDFAKLMPSFKAKSADSRIRRYAYIIGIFFASTLVGAILGYMYGYNKIMRPMYLPPTFSPLPKAVRWCVVVGAILGFLFPIILGIIFIILTLFFGDVSRWDSGTALILLTNLGVTLVAMWFFNRWWNGLLAYWEEVARHGTARWGTNDDLNEYVSKGPNNIIVGGDYIIYSKKGHFLTTAGTRSGKGVNLIIPNLLGVVPYSGSWVVIDPKGENAAITARRQRDLGREVIIINPWDLLDLGSQPFNPFDLIQDSESINMPDDAQVIAEMIIPSSKEKSSDTHWDTRARSLLAGVLMHIVTTEEPENVNMDTLWKKFQLTPDGWNNLLINMASNTHEVNGEIIRATANAQLSSMEFSMEEAAGTLSTARRWIDIFKSQPLRNSMGNSSFDLNTLTEGNKTIYVIIPADKLKSHYTWLRLVITTALRACIRNPKDRVTFILDECYALGYLEELQVGFGTYAGFNVSLWAIFQSSGQVLSLYGKDEANNFYG